MAAETAEQRGERKAVKRAEWSVRMWADQWVAKTVEKLAHHLEQMMVDSWEMKSVGPSVCLRVEQRVE